jgi:hypothetical protein
MMSNSRADRHRLGLVLTAAGWLVAGCAGPRALAAPDAPRPMRDTAWLSPPPAREGTPAPQVSPVEIRSVSPLGVRGDSLLERLAGKNFLSQARRPLAIEVITATEFGGPPRDASLEIYLDGHRVGDTWPLPPNRLLVFLPDARRLPDSVAVTVAWLGNEERTRSRRPVTLTAEQLQPFR